MTFVLSARDFIFNLADYLIEHYLRLSFAKGAFMLSLDPFKNKYINHLTDYEILR